MSPYSTEPVPTVGHWVAAHSTSALVVKGGAVVAKSVVTHGLASTASAVAGGAIVTGFVVGGVVWTNSLIQLLGQAVVDLSNGNKIQALQKFAKLYGRLHHVSIEAFPDVVENVLKKIGFALEDAHMIAKFIGNNEREILRFSGLI
jgi:uncharacterized membrane protein